MSGRNTWEWVHEFKAWSQRIAHTEARRFHGVADGMPEQNLKHSKRLAISQHASALTNFWRAHCDLHFTDLDLETFLTLAPTWQGTLQDLVETTQILTRQGEPR